MDSEDECMEETTVCRRELRYSELTEEDGWRDNEQVEGQVSSSVSRSNLVAFILNKKKFQFKPHPL